MPRKRASEVPAYDSDGGFVANDNEDDKPKAKRAKTSQKATAPAGGRNGRAGGKDEEVVGGGGKVDANGDAFWEVCLLLFLRLSVKVNWEEMRLRLRGGADRDGGGGGRGLDFVYNCGEGSEQITDVLRDSGGCSCPPSGGSRSPNSKASGW